MRAGLLTLTAAAAVCLLSGCARQVPARGPVTYRFESGRTALLRQGVAFAPQRAPEVVHRAIAAGNRLQGMPYKWGGGHARHDDWGYDCSGTVSYVLREAGLIDDAIPSRGYFRYGRRVRGDGSRFTPARGTCS